MIDLGTVRPGSTIRIPFSSFDKDDGSSITMTNFAAGDILVYKDGSTTERASTSGYTATTDFDSKTGKHLAIIGLADNTTSGFWNAGSEYLVAIDAVTVDAVTTGGWIARFRIGYPSAWFDTTIATLSSQTSFTLTAGPAEDDAINGCTVIIHDIASAVQCGQAIVSDYTGSTKTVTLVAGTTFTAAAGDNISVMWPQLITANSFAASAITASSIASGAITSAKFAAGAIDAAAIADNAIDLATFAADAKALMGVVAFGTLQAVTNTTAQLATGETFADDEIIGATILFRSATTGAGQSRVITDYVGATDTCTFDALTTTPTGTITYVIFATSPASTSAPIAANVTQWNGSAVATPNTAGVPKVDTVSVSGTAQTARDIGASVLLSSGTGTGQISLSSGTVTVGTNNDKTGYTASTVSDKTGYALTSAYDFAKGTTAMTESYATDGAAMTPAQALHQIWSLLSEKNIASTTLTAKKLDGSSTAMTFTLDSATTPTSITRAT